MHYKEVAFERARVMSTLVSNKIQQPRSCKHFMKCGILLLKNALTCVEQKKDRLHLKNKH